MLEFLWSKIVGKLLAGVLMEANIRMRHEVLWVLIYLEVVYGGLLTFVRFFCSGNI